MFYINQQTSLLPKLKPREKIIEYGIKSLNDAELLATILGTGYRGLSIEELSKNLLGEFGTKGLFQFTHLEDIQEQSGLPPVKSMQVLSVGEILRRITKRDNTKIESSELLYEYLKPSLEQSTFERLHIVCVDSQRRVLFSGLIAQGDGNKIHVNLAQIFHHPIRLNCTHFYLAHNHPYGSCKPSAADKKMTMQIQKEAQKLGLSFDDHIIIADDGFYSFALDGTL